MCPFLISSGSILRPLGEGWLKVGSLESGVNTPLLAAGCFINQLETPMRILHTMLRVGNLDRSIAFYTDVLGMKLLRRNDYPDGKFTLAFVGYQDEKNGAVLELTYNWGIEKYDLGSGYGHIAIEVDNAGEACELVKQKGGNVIREAGPMKHGTTVIAFVSDPDGYKIEFIQKKS